MYIIELIAKIIKSRKVKPQVGLTQEEFEDCEHIYYAIDSTSDYLACSKCGNVIKNYKKNIFKI
jgi:hypothetical protein